MTGYVCGIDWINAEAMKYWSFPSGYKKDKKEEVHNLILSGDYLGALKVDGFYQRVVKDEDGNCFMISRSKNVKGEATNKIEWVPHLNSFFEKLPNGTVLICECYFPGNEGSKKVTSILGCLKEKAIARQKENKLHLYIFDIMAYNNNSYVKTDFLERIYHLTELQHFMGYNEYVEWAFYYSGAKLWSKLQEALADGREGMVITRYDCPVYFKRTPARMTIKIKKELQDTVDCFFTGKYSEPTRIYTGKEIENWKYWQDTITGEKKEGNFYKAYALGEGIEPVTKPFFLDMAGSLQIGVMKKCDGKCTINGVEYEGYNVVPIGWLSGLPDEVKSNVKEYAFKPIEVTAMEIDKESGSLRHGKFTNWRDDLQITDCTWEKIYG